MAQEKQLLDENLFQTENAQNIFQTWIQVKKKKHKGRTSKINTMNDEECTNVSNAINSMHSTNVKDSTPLTGLINQEDYQLKRMSKKKKKQQRDRDEDLARSLSRLTTSNNCVVDSHPSKFYGVQSSSKVIKKEIRRKKSHSGHRNKEETNNDKKYRSKVKTTGRNDAQTEYNRFDFSSNDDSGKDVQTDPIVLQIKNIMNQYPNKKFKVEAEELTPFQKKQLQKSGLRIELKSEKRERKKTFKEIIKKMKHSMDFDSSEM